MLSLFPELLTFTLIAPFLLRIVSGVLFAVSGWQTLLPKHAEKLVCFQNAGFRPVTFWLYLVGIVELVGGALLVLGLFTQLAALALLIVTLGAILLKFKNPGLLSEPTAYYVLLFAILASLLFSGAGCFAFDLPL